MLNPSYQSVFNTTGMYGLKKYSLNPGPIIYVEEVIITIEDVHVKKSHAHY